MSGGDELTNQDGPAVRGAYRRAGQIDEAQTVNERRRAWARLIPSALAALAEDALRRWVILAALLLSVVVALAGATSGELGLAVFGVGIALAGAIVVLVAMARLSYGKQWAVFLGVIGVQALLMVAISQAG